MTRPASPRVDPVALAHALGRPAPTAQQEAVISAPLAPMLVVAGAGSGKTETIAQRVVYLVANGIARPDQILGLTFTRKAAGELSTRIRTRLRAVAGARIGDPDALLAAQEGQPAIGTYHAFAGDVIREFGPLIGLEPAGTVLTPTGAWLLARRVVARWDGDLDTDHSPDRVTEELLAITSSLADHLATVDALDAELATVLAGMTEAPPSARQRGPVHSALKSAVESLASRRAILPLVRAYAAAKRDARVLDFADQMQMTARIIAESPQAIQALRARYPVVFLDEYQDTGHSQRMILRGIFGRGVDSSLRGLAVTAVGDPVQSIYSWRGASASNLPAFPTDFPEADGTPAGQRELLISFRNDRAVLDVANAVSREAREGAVAVGLLEPSPTAEQGIATAALLSTVDDENAWLAGQLDDVWRSSDVAPTVAVLVRRRADMAGIALALRERGLPVEIVGTGGLIDEPEVADVIAMLRLVVDHGSGPAAVRILTGARLRLGMFDLVALSRRARELGGGRRTGSDGSPAADDPVGVMRAALSEVTGVDELDDAGLVDAVADPGDASAYSPGGWRIIAKLGAELRRLRSLLTAPLPDLVRDIERILNLDIEAMLTPVGRGHLDEFADLVSELAVGGAGPVELLDYLAAAADREDGLAPGDVDVAEGRIQILTVHAAKGLEWDVVAVPHLSAGVFPSSVTSVWFGEAGDLPPALRGDRDELPRLDVAADTDQGGWAAAVKEHRESWKTRHLAEERRLFYVAVTRARHRLLLSAHHWSATGKKPAGPGEFFQELVDGDWAADAPTLDAAVLAAQGARGPLVAADPCAPAPVADAENPMLATPTTSLWPVDPLGSRRGEVARGAEAVRAARQAIRQRAAAHPDPSGDEAPNPAGAALFTGNVARPTGEAALPAVERFDPDGARDDPEGWMRDARLLLAYRASFTSHEPVDIELPPAMSVSSLVELADDPERLAHRIARPMPTAPSPRARLGSTFHAWVEQFYRGEPLLDLAQLPGAHDSDAAGDPLLAELVDAFRSSPWAARTPVAVEIPFATHLAGMAVRGRIDAVFAEPDGSVTVVDWKTGQVPPPSRSRVVAIQLVAYRLAWSRLSGLPLDSVHAVFHYVTAGVTVAPQDLMDARELEALVDEATSRSGSTERAAEHRQ